MTLRVHPDDIVKRSESPLLAEHHTWERVRIGQIAHLQNGGAFSSKLFNTSETGMPVIRIRNVGTTKSTTYYSGEYQDKYLVFPDDLLVGMDGDFRVSRWQGSPALLNQRVCRLDMRNPQMYDGRFLYHVLQGYLDAVHAVTSAVTVKHLSSRTISQLPVPLPPLAEQGRIVERIEELFARLDAVDASLASLLEKLETLRSAILADAFHTNRPLPPGWEKTTIGKVCLKPQYGWTSKSARVKGLPYIRTTDLSGGSVDWESVPSCLTLPDDESKYLLNHGDILVCRAGSVGISYLVTDPPRAVFASYLIRLRTKGGIVDPQYLNLFMQSSAYWNAISETKVGIATPNVNATRLASIPFPLAPRDRQRCIARRVGSRLGKLDILTASMEDCLQTSKILRQSVLAEAFAGRLVPQDPDDEPASVLLDRIRASRQARPQRRKVRA